MSKAKILSLFFTSFFFYGCIIAVPVDSGTASKLTQDNSNSTNQDNSISDNTGTKLPASNTSAQMLQGKFCSYSGSSSSSSSYSSSTWAQFDGQGNFTYGEESSFSSGTGLAYGGSPSGSGTYQINGNQVLLRYSDGSSEAAQIYNQSGGSITELMYSGSLFAPGLCG